MSKQESPSPGEGLPTPGEPAATPGATGEPKAPVDAIPAPGEAPASPGETPAAASAGPHPALLDPTLARERAPDTFKAKFETSEGDFVIEVHRDWAPNGADRFYNLVKIGFYNDVRFFRVLNDPSRPFMAQFGINGDPKVSARWRVANIPDDPVTRPNERGSVSFATAGPNTRTTQVFINYSDNSRLDSMGFSPIGMVTQGMDAVDALHGGYGEGAPNGRGPHQGMVQQRGNEYLNEQFPELDYVKRATILSE